MRRKNASKTRACLLKGGLVLEKRSQRPADAAYVEYSELSPRNKIRLTLKIEFFLKQKGYLLSSLSILKYKILSSKLNVQAAISYQ